MSWVPADTEAIDVARFFDLRISDWNTMAPDFPDFFASVARESAIDLLRELRDGKYAKSLLGRRVAISLSPGVRLRFLTRGEAAVIKAATS